MLSLYDSLRQNFLQSKKLSITEYNLFNKTDSNKELIAIKSSRTSQLLVLISLLILVFSVIQQNNPLAPFAFLIGLSSFITSLVYYREKEVEKSIYKSRVISSILLFILAIYFLENSFQFLNWIILIFTILLSFFFFENIQNNNKVNLKEAE